MGTVPAEDRSGPGSARALVRRSRRGRGWWCEGQAGLLEWGWGVGGLGVRLGVRDASRAEAGASGRRASQGSGAAEPLLARRREWGACCPLSQVPESFLWPVRRVLQLLVSGLLHTLLVNTLLRTKELLFIWVLSVSIYCQKLKQGKF